VARTSHTADWCPVAEAEETPRACKEADPVTQRKTLRLSGAPKRTLAVQLPFPVSTTKTAKKSPAMCAGLSTHTHTWYETDTNQRRSARSPLGATLRGKEKRP